MEPASSTRRPPGKRRESHARPASAPDDTPAAPAPSSRHGADLLSRGICGRGHTLADVYALEIHPDAIRCARCVDEIAADAAALPAHWPEHGPAPAQLEAPPLEVLRCAVCGRIIGGQPQPFDVICGPCVDVLE